MSHEQEITVLASAANDRRGAVVASIVPEGRRMEFLPSKFGVTAMLKVETAVFAWMERLCPTYIGGYWNFVELSNGGAYMVPSSAEFFNVCVEGNGFEGRVSADTAGVIATAFALNGLIWQGHDKLSEKYEQLLEYISHHPDQIAIRRALD
jgi:hypothetical protein